HYSYHRSGIKVNRMLRLVGHMRVAVLHLRHPGIGVYQPVEKPCLYTSGWQRMNSISGAGLMLGATARTMSRAA
ncbi:MAG: hypothetical protein H7838_13335, partial [Magnetococcus sp. DMHC-8]